MTDIKNLANKEAIQKMKDLAEATDICIFATSLSERPIPSRPMSTQEVDAEGNLWFMSRKSSEKTDDIKNDEDVQLFYANISHSEYLSIYGKAVVMQDREKAKELWSPLLKTWFTKGIDDPELTIIKVTPVDAYYWDTKHNRYVALLKMVTGAVTGISMDDSIQGEIKI